MNVLSILILERIFNKRILAVLRNFVAFRPVRPDTYICMQVFMISVRRKRSV